MMKIPTILLSLLLVTVAFADDRYPLTIGTNLTATYNGLQLAAIADKSIYSVNEVPSITVTFSNKSPNDIVLLNHFALSAVGPLFRPLIRNPENPNEYRELIFAEQNSIYKANPKWIILKAGESHQFQSSLSTPLSTGNHALQVQYSVSGPAESTIAECRKEPSCPTDFWHGDLLSNVMEIKMESNKGVQAIGDKSPQPDP